MRFLRDYLRSGWLQSTLFYGVVLNVPVWIASRLFGFRSGGWFALEYIAVGIVAIIIPRWLAAVLVLIADVIDLVGEIARSYSVPSTTIFANLEAADYFPPLRKCLVAGVIILAIISTLAAVRFSPARLNRSEKKMTAASLLVFAALCITWQSLMIFHATGQAPILLRKGKVDGIESQYRSVPRVIRLGVFRIFNHHTLHELSRKINGIAGTSSPVPSAMAIATKSAPLFEADDLDQKPNIVLVLVESWGLTKQSSIADSLIQPYAEPGMAERYRAISGSVPFFGPTLFGEGRELCGTTIGESLQFAAAQDLANCLPLRLRQEGYRTIAAHGMNGMFFARDRWYRRIAFDEIWFNNSFRRVGLPDCAGAFMGTCDASIATWIGNRLAARQPQPEFFYWMTLNSHLPVPLPPPLTVKAACPPASWVASSPSACSWYQLISNVHRSLAQIALGSLGRPTLFVIVGDHVPPFRNPGLFRAFSSTEVPYVILIPRSETPSSRQLASTLGKTPLNQNTN